MVKSSRVLHDLLSNLLLGCLIHFILLEVLCEFGLGSLEDGSLVGLTGLHLHQILHHIELVNHSDTVIHDSFLLFLDLVELVEALSDGHNRWVLSQRGGISGLWNRGGKILSSLTQECESLRVGLELLLDLDISRGSHLDLLLELEQLLLVLPIDS